MRKRSVAILFVGVSVFFWAVVCALLLEWWERYAVMGGKVDAFVSPIISEAEKKDLAVYEATAVAAPQPPAEVAAKYPDLAALDSVAGDGLDKLAVQWEGVIYECDKDGGILTRHAASDAVLAAGLAVTTAGASNISNILPAGHPKWGRDLLSKLDRSVREWRNPQPRLPHMVGCEPPWVDYAVPVPEYPHVGFRFMFHPFQGPGKTEPGVYMVAVPWRWQAVFGGFRPNYYERDAYPQFPKSEFWTNSRCFRDEELAVPKPAGVYRIVCIGGSTTLEGPRNDLTYPKMLQQMLRDHFKTDAIEVVNCGVDGGTIIGQCDRFDDCLALNPDMVIHYNFVNDASALMDNVLKATIMRTEWRRKVMGVLCKSKFLAHRCRWPWSLVMPSASGYRAEIDLYLRPSLLELCQRTKRTGARFAVSSFAGPDLYHLPAQERAWFRNHFWFTQAVPVELDDYFVAAGAFNGMARDFCEKEGALYIPVAEELRGGIETFTDNWHMHISGIQRKAEIMFKNLVNVIAKDLESRKGSAPAVKS